MKKIFGFIMAFIVVAGITFGSLPALAQNLIVVIDPGHNTEGSGANCAYNGKEYHEAVMNLTIAKAAKKHLEEYKGVTVYLTRENYSTDLDNADRVAFASSKGANFLLSIHINAQEGNSSANGSLAIASWSTTFEADAAYATREVGTNILRNFENIGFNNKGLMLVKAQEREADYDVYYPDGTKQDYYGMTQRALRIGMPCTLVECGFITSPKDMALLSDNDVLDRMGKGCADGVAEYYGLSKETAIDAPDTYEINGFDLDFSRDRVVSLLYPMTGEVTKTGDFATASGDGAGHTNVYLDYMGMALKCKKYKTLSVTMKAGSASQLELFVSSSKDWNHSDVVKSGNKFTAELTDEFKTYEFNLSALPVWENSLNYMEFYLSGSEYLMIKSIKFSGNGSGSTPAPATAVPTTPTPTPKPTEAPTPAPTAAPTDVPLTPEATDLPSAEPTNTPEVTAPAEPTDSQEPVSTGADASDSEDKGKKDVKKTPKKTMAILTVCIIIVLALFLAMLAKGRKK